MDSVNQKKIRRADPSKTSQVESQANMLRAEKSAHKLSNRKNKRKICKLVKQVENLRKKCRVLQDENIRLKQTIDELSKGQHDIILKGHSQEDMVDLLQRCRTSPILEEKMREQDDESGTLKTFWREQVARQSDKNKRRRWNPIVLRFMLNLWEKIGEKGFRVLEDEKVMRTMYMCVLCMCAMYVCVLCMCACYVCVRAMYVCVLCMYACYVSVCIIILYIMCVCILKCMYMLHVTDTTITIQTNSLARAAQAVFVRRQRPRYI